ncbi:MAG: hypothetical protein RSF73_04970 [Ruthenibacterium sp.]
MKNDKNQQNENLLSEEISLSQQPDSSILPEFNYEKLDAQTVATLHSAENMIRNARKDYIIKIADAVGMAHDELCGTVVANCDEHNQYTEDTVVPRCDNGQFSEKEYTFRAWCESVGLGKDTAYRLLQVSDLISHSTPNEQKILEQASPSLLYAAARPSAPIEAVSAVKSGAVTTHAEYQKLIKELSDTQSQLAESEKEKAEWQAIAKDKTQEKTALLQERSSVLDELDMAHCKIKELESRPVEVAVQQADPKEVERLATEKAARENIELREQLEASQYKVLLLQKNVQRTATQLKAVQDAPTHMEDIPISDYASCVAIASDFANTINTCRKTFLMMATCLKGAEYRSAATSLIDAAHEMADILTAKANTAEQSHYEEDEPFD